MPAPAQVRRIALAVALTSASMAAPAGAQSQPREPTGVPLTPPPLESANPQYERTPTARPSGSAGLALLGLFAGPLGFALGGFTSTSAPGNIGVPFSPPPRILPVAPGIEQAPPAVP